MRSKLIHILTIILLISMSGIIYMTLSKDSDKTIVVEEQPTDLPLKPELEIDQYMPITKDNVWVYTVNDNPIDKLSVSVEFIKDHTMQLKYQYKDQSVARVVLDDGNGLYEVAKVEDVKIKADYTMLRQYKQAMIKLPLEEGRTWRMAEGRTSTITAIDKKIQTKLGELKTIEITTEQDDSEMTMYYAEKIGLVYVEIDKGNQTDIIEIESFGTSTTMKETIDVYYANEETKALEVIPQEVTIMTNEEPKHFLTDVLKMTPSDTYLPAISSDATINTIYLEEESNRVVVDLNEKYAEMGYTEEEERLAVMSLVNTIGSYYDASYVVITVQGSPYTINSLYYNKEMGIKVGGV